jgi:hypothetical protein
LLCAKSDAIEAMQFALNCWSALIYYGSDRRTEIDNLIAERALYDVADREAELLVRRHRHWWLTRGCDV